MDITTLVKGLDISYFGIGWARLTGGWKGVGIYLAKAVTKLLRKLPAEDLMKYGDVIIKVCGIIKQIVVDFVPEKYRESTELTVEALSGLADHIKDGEYSQDELDSDIDALERCIASWKQI